MRHALRVWSKGLRRDVKHWHACHTADVVFLSPAKSGRTWVRAMLSHVYHLNYGTPADAIVSRDRFHRLDSRIPRFFFSHGGQEPRLVRRRLTLAGLRDKTVICLVRDPRDVVVSFHHQRQQRSKQLDHRERSSPDIPMSEQRVLDSLVDITRKIERLRTLAAEHPDGHLFRYEDFHADAPSELARLLRVLGHDVPRAHIDEAVAVTAFDNLKQREAAGYYRSDNLQPGDAAEPNSFKVRRGKVGGHRDELPAELFAELDRVIDANLGTGLGYRSDEQPPTLRAAAAR